MRIKMLTAVAGIRWSASAGDVIDMDDATAKRLIAKGAAEPVPAEYVTPEPETAEIRPPEQAVARRKKQ